LTAGWIFTTTTDELFVGGIAEEAKLREEYERNVNYKIDYFRNAAQNGDLLNLK
jgi:hemoglobin